MALIDNHFVDFNTGVAVSASVPTLAYFTAEQRKEMERVGRDELNPPKLVHYGNIPAGSLTLSPKRPPLPTSSLGIAEKLIASLSLGTERCGTKK
jgi:hypothetical protein